MTSCPGLRRLSLIAWFVSARPARSLAALGEARVGVPCQIEGEPVAARRQLGDAPPLGEPLGGVLGLYPELVREHLGRDRRRGEADHRALAMDLFPGGSKSRHGS